MLRQRQGYRLRGWLEEVEQHGEPELQAFARNLHKEESAVQAGLTLAWSNGCFQHSKILQARKNS
jgi:transposase